MSIDDPASSPLGGEDRLTTALAGGPTLATPFPAAGSNSLADQVKMVARMVSTAAEVGARLRWGGGLGSAMRIC